MVGSLPAEPSAQSPCGRRPRARKAALGRRLLLAVVLVLAVVLLGGCLSPRPASLGAPTSVGSPLGPGVPPSTVALALATSAAPLGSGSPHPHLSPDPGTGGWVSCATYISCGGGGLAWEIDSGGFQVNGYGYPSSSSDYSLSQAESDIDWELSNYGSMISAVSSHYGVPEINIVTETGPETSFGTDGVDDIMQDLSSSWCGGGAGGQSPDSWALGYADANWAGCSAPWIHFISFAAGTSYLAYQSSRYGANFDPGVLGPAYNAGSLVYTTVYSCSGDYDAWFLVMCSGGGLTASYSWNIAVAYNAALNVGGGGTTLSLSYAMTDATTGTSLSCGGSFYAGDTIDFTGSVSGGTSPYTWSWSFGDGYSAGGNPTSHVYQTPGTVNPTLKVTDSSGNSATTGSGCDFTVIGITTTMTIYDLTTSSAVSCGGSVNTLDTLRFAAAVTGGTSPYSYAWSFGDGSTGSGDPVNHVYTAIATVDPTVTVTDSNGLTATAGQGCDLHIIGTPVTFYTDPATVGTILVGSNAYTDGQSVALVNGATYALSVTSPNGYVFDGWTFTGSVSVAGPNAPTTTLTITGNSASTVTVAFITQTSVKFESDPAGDSSAVIGGSTYSSGETITASVGEEYTLLAEPNPGYVFLEWEVAGSSISVESPFSAWTNLTISSSEASTLIEVVEYNVPLAPTDLHIAQATTTSLQVAWDPPPGTLLTYSLGSSEGTSPPEGSPGGFQLSSFGAGDNVYTLTGLSPGTQYWVALAAVNATGTGAWSPWVAGTTLELPGSPLYLTVGGIGPTFAVLSWQAPESGSSLSGYAINCSSSSAGATNRTYSDLPPTLSVENATGLTPDASYSCVVLSVAGPYVSPPSNSATFATLGETSAAAATAPAWERRLLSPPWFELLLVGLAVAFIAPVALFLARRSRQRAPTDEQLLLEMEAKEGSPPGAVPSEVSREVSASVAVSGAGEPPAPAALELDPAPVQAPSSGEVGGPTTSPPLAGPPSPTGRPNLPDPSRRPPPSG